MNPPSASALLESYVRTADFETHAATLELSPALWDIFALTENRITAADIVRHLGLDAATAHLGLRELAGHRLVRRHVQSWRDYRAAAPAAEPVSVATAPQPPPTLAVQVVPAAKAQNSEGRENRLAAPEPVERPGEPPLVVAPPPAPVVAASTDRSAPPAPPAARVTAPPAPLEIHLTVSAPARRQAPPAEPPGLIRLALRRTAPPPPAPLPVEPASAAAGWRLRPILDAISRHGGGQVTGQLLAYRVFLGIPAELLDRAGLYSLSLTENDFTIRDPEFYAALRRSVREVAGLDVATLDCAAEPSTPALP